MRFLRMIRIIENHIYSTDDVYIAYDRFLDPKGDIKKNMREIINLLYETFIKNEPTLLINYILNFSKWRNKNGKDIIEFIKSVKKTENPTQRFLLYLELIDEILFNQDNHLNYNFKLFFSLQGILITLNTFIQLSEDYKNVKLFNIFNKQFISEFKQLHLESPYLNFITDTLKNFFVLDDMKNQITVQTTNDLLYIFCSIFNVRLLYSSFPVLTKGRNGEFKDRLVLKRIYPAFELMNRCKKNIVKSNNIKVMLYMNFNNGNLFYLYNDEEILNFNLHHQLQNFIFYLLSLQRNNINMTVLELWNLLLIF